jgi:acetolactate decarboxylase
MWTYQNNSGLSNAFRKSSISRHSQIIKYGKALTALLILVSVILSACKTGIEKTGEEEERVLVQVSVIDGLLQGIYDGTYPIGKLLDRGNMGTGTFDKLNGEMMILNDTAFQILSSGRVVIPAPETLTPFAAITEFRADTSFLISEITFDSIEAAFDHFFPTPNLFYAIHIKGDFRYVKTRSVPEQSKPYPPLVEVTRKQPEFEFENVKGDIAGFYTPDYTKGIAITGFHLHFLNSDRTGGGHITRFTLIEGTMEIGFLSDFQLILPEEGDFFLGNFNVDRTKELEEVEKQ